MADKFSELKRLCAEAKGKGIDEVRIAFPWVLGDTYEELIENLGMLAAAGLCLRIASPERPALTGPTAEG
jgi:hypothetical protein